VGYIYTCKVTGAWITISFTESKKNSFRPIDGYDFWKGTLVSPYWSIKLRKSFLLLNTFPESSETSRSSQLEVGYNSEMEFKEKLENFLRDSTQKKKKSFLKC